MNVMSSKNKTMYERLGGEAAIALLVDRFHERITLDPELEPYFRHVPLSKLRNMQLEFFSAALEGPVHYSGRPLDQVHKGRGITSKQLSRFMQHLMATIAHTNPDDQDRNEMYSRIALYGDSIIDNPNEGTE
jgi:hemoglobin